MTTAKQNEKYITPRTGSFYEVILSVWTAGQASEFIARPSLGTRAKFMTFSRI